MKFYIQFYLFDLQIIDNQYINIKMSITSSFLFKFFQIKEKYLLILHG